MSEAASLPRQRTGIELIDRLLPTGLPRAGTVLILYDPGSGETELLSHFIIRYMQAKQSVLYLTLDNFPANIRQLIHEMAGDVDWSSLVFVDCYSKSVGANADEAYVEDPENLSAISIAISNIMRERRISLLALNSLSTLIRRRDLRSAIEFLRILVGRARQAKCLSLVLLNRKGFHPSTIASAQEIVDGVIELKIEESSGDMIRSLRISKMVGTKHLAMWTPFEISDAGEYVPSLSDQKGRNNHLPTKLTPLIGRETAVAEARNLFLQMNARLVTLTGPGGAGKTSLGLEVARSLVDGFADGAYFVPLERITDPKLPSVIMQTLGLKELRDLSPTSTLLDHLRNKEMLLLLDNFEQIITSAPQLADLLAACQKLKVLVTSRQALHIHGEHEFYVPPLDLPDLKRLPRPNELRKCASVELFVERGQAVKPDFGINDQNARAVAEICVLLDGLPLALELVAPTLKLFSPEKILTQLKDNPYFFKGPHDLPERQRTLQDTIGWSYHMLNEEEKSLFGKLSIFTSGCTADAVVSVCSDGSDKRILEHLWSLVDKNMVVREEDGSEVRFTMLSTIRAFAIRSLVDSREEQAVRRRHAKYFGDLVERAEPELLGPHEVEWIQRVELEHDNLRSALEWCLKQNDASSALRMAGGLWRFWYTRGHLTEGLLWLSRALALPSGPASLRGEALIGAGAMAHTQGQYPEARRFYEEGLEIFTKLSDRRGIAAALTNLGTLANDQGEYSEARQLFEASLAISKEFGDDQGKSHLVNNLALLAQETGDYILSKSLFEESLAIKRKLNDERGIAATILNLGNVARDTANYELAHTHYEESLVIFKKLREERGIAYCLINLTLVAIGQGDYHQAKMLLEQSLPIFEQLGDQLGFAVFLQTRADLARAQQDYRLSSILYKDSLRMRNEIGDRVGIIECIEGLAGLASLQGHAELSVRLFSGAQSLRKTTGVPLPPAEESDSQFNLANARNGMTEKDFDVAWEGGRMKPSELVELALEGKAKKI